MFLNKILSYSIIKLSKFKTIENKQENLSRGAKGEVERRGIKRNLYQRENSQRGMTDIFVRPSLKFEEKIGALKRKSSQDFSNE